MPLFGGKSKLQVDLGDLENETGHLSDFLKTNLKVEVTAKQNKLTLNSEKVTPQEVQRVVTKFVYRRNLNGTHWVSVEGTTVRINRFKGARKPEKEKKKAGHQSITQSWGL